MQVYHGSNSPGILWLGASLLFVNRGSVADVLQAGGAWLSMLAIGECYPRVQRSIADRWYSLFTTWYKAEADSLRGL